MIGIFITRAVFKINRIVELLEKIDRGVASEKEDLVELLGKIAREQVREKENQMMHGTERGGEAPGGV